jgi:hypothetical protein
VADNDAIHIEVLQSAGQEDIAEGRGIGLRKKARPKRGLLIHGENGMAGLA